MSVNDIYGFTEACAKIVDSTLQLLGLCPLGDWREASERAFISMFAKALERRYQSPHAPEEFKLLLIGAQFVRIPKDLQGRLREDLEADDAKYGKLCDIDIWVRVGKFPLSGWDKISSKKVSKKLAIQGRELVKAGLHKFDAAMAAAPKEKVEEINQMVKSLLVSRAETLPREA